MPPRIHNNAKMEVSFTHRPVYLLKIVAIRFGVKISFWICKQNIFIGLGNEVYGETDEQTPPPNCALWKRTHRSISFIKTGFFVAWVCGRSSCLIICVMNFISSCLETADIFLRRKERCIRDSNRLLLCSCLCRESFDKYSILFLWLTQHINFINWKRCVLHHVIR